MNSEHWVHADAAASQPSSLSLLGAWSWLSATVATAAQAAIPDHKTSTSLLLQMMSLLRLSLVSDSLPSLPKEATARAPP